MAPKWLKARGAHGAQLGALASKFGQVRQFVPERISNDAPVEADSLVVSDCFVRSTFADGGMRRWSSNT